MTPDDSPASETALENTLQGGRRSAPADSKPAKDGPAPKDMPSAGPHADPSLINPDATPGAGSLPDVDGPNVEGGSS